MYLLLSLNKTIKFDIIIQCTFVIGFLLFPFTSLFSGRCCLVDKQDNTNILLKPQLLNSKIIIWSVSAIVMYIKYKDLFLLDHRFYPFKDAETDLSQKDE